MKSIFRLITLVLTLGGWLLAGLSLHVIRTPDRIDLVPKQSLGFSDTWVDTRSWTAADVPNHPELVARLLSAGREADLAHLFESSSRGDLHSQLVSALRKSPTAAGATASGHTELSAGPISVTLPF
jgi:hypothetical protein